MTDFAAVEELRGLLTEEILPAHRDRWGESQEWEALVDFQRKLAQAGWSAPGWPKEIGGRALDVATLVACEAVFQELRAPTKVSVYGVNNVGPTIAAYGSAEQKVRHLDAILKATEIWCQGFSEPDAGSDLASLQARAFLRGDEFVIDGQKVWTSIGLHSTHCMLLVRTDMEAPKHRGISVLLVELDRPGVTRRAIRQMNGGAEFAEMFFDSVRVPTSALLGPLNAGWRVTMTTLGYERAGVISLAGQLAQEAEQSIRGLRGLTGPFRDRAISTLIEGRLLALTGQRALSSGDGSSNGSLPSLIKLGWSKLSVDTARLVVDASGISAVAGDDLSAAQRLLRSCSASIAGGTTEILKSVLAERVLGLPK